MSLASLLILSLGVVGLGSDDSAADNDTKMIQGTWVIISTESEGQVIDSASLKTRDVKMIYDGNQILAKTGEMSVSMGTFQLDAKAAPKTYDRIYPDGSPRRGIYKLEGATLTICIGPIGKDRPATFATKPGDGCTVVVYKREAP